MTPEEKREYDKKYREENNEERKQNRKKYSEDNKIRLKAYYAALKIDKKNGNNYEMEKI
jgi:cytochrome c553